MSNIAERGAHRCEHFIANYVKTTLERPQSGSADTVIVELSGEPRLWAVRVKYG